MLSDTLNDITHLAHALRLVGLDRMRLKSRKIGSLEPNRIYLIP